jgi:DNA-3-methyladenine glycosylase
MVAESFYRQPALQLAPALLGCTLVHASSAGPTAGIIVETEAYHAGDEASHSFRGQTARNAVMFGPAGRAYIYFSYGVHYCLNVVGEGSTGAEAVLIRALEPTAGMALMEQRRQTTVRLNLCSGPGKLTQAMGIGPAQNGASFTTPELQIVAREQTPLILTSPRIGISRAADKPWRFFVANNRYVSKDKFNKAAVPYRYDSQQTSQM